MTNRRSFIKNIGLLGLTAPFINPAELLNSARKLPALGIQLYMVKEDMEKDTPGTLKQLGEMGYTQIESYGGNKGMFWGMSNKDFKKLAGDNGLTLISSHYNDEPAGFEAQVEKAAEIGMKYLICPWKGPQKSIDNFKKFADEFNKNGEICKKHGLRFGYHPHDYPYKKVDGQLPIDVLLANTDRDLVDFEMDVYWVVRAGQDPISWLDVYPGRFKLIHVKDMDKTDPKLNTEAGTGSIDYKKIFAATKSEGVKYYILEQENFKIDPYVSIAQSNKYLRETL